MATKGRRLPPGKKRKATCQRHLSPDERRRIVKSCREGRKKVEVAAVFGVSRQTVHKWCKRANHRGRETFRDKSHRPHKIKRKTTEGIVDQVFFLRKIGFGTKRIVDVLKAVPSYLKKEFEKRFNQIWKEATLSRTTIHKILKKLGINKPKREPHKWKTVRSKEPNDLWQIDFKEKVLVDGERKDILVVEDNYSRYVVCCREVENKKTETITKILDECIEVEGATPRKVLVDNGPLKNAFEEWAVDRGIEVIRAHPYYPQDKGKVEKLIQSIKRECILVSREVSTGLRDILQEWREWYNFKRVHAGIGVTPATLYFKTL